MRREMSSRRDEIRPSSLLRPSMREESVATCREFSLACSRERRST